MSYRLLPSIPPKPGRGRGNANFRRYQLRQFTRAFEAQSGLCHYCRRPMAVAAPPDRPAPYQPPDLATWDHLTPKSRGGDNSIANRVLACRSCNVAKGVRTEAEYRRDTRAEATAS